MGKYVNNKTRTNKKATKENFKYHYFFKFKDILFIVVLSSKNY